MAAVTVDPVAARHPDIPQDPLPGLTPEQRARADIAADLREQARMALARAIRYGQPHGAQSWHRRMHRAMIRQAWNVQQLPVCGVRDLPARPLSYRVER